MRKSIFKRLVTTVIAASFMTTTLLTPFNFLVSAATLPDSYGENLLSGIKMTAHYSLDGSTRTALADNGKFSLINDGNLTSEFFVGNPVYFAEEKDGNKVYYKDGTKVFLDLQFDLGEAKNVKAFYMLNHNNSLLRTNRYQLYLANSSDNLFFSENLQKDYTNNGAEENVIEFDEEKSARYFGIRILNPVSAELSNVTQVYTRIIEVALFGTGLSLEDRYGSNLLDGLKMFAEYSTDGENLTNLADNGKFPLINDGKDDTEFFVGTPKFAETIDGNKVYHKDGSKVFLNLGFELGNAKKIKAFYMCNSSNELLVTNRYKLYLSKTKSDLFDDSKSLVKDYINSSKDQKNLIVFEEAIEAKYFGIKILNPVSTEISNVSNVYTRINEIALYGEDTPPPTIDGENLLQGVNMLAYYSTDGETKTQLKDNGRFSNINDGDITTEFFTSTPKFAEEVAGSKVFYNDGSKVYLDLVFDLDESQKLNAVSVVNNSNPTLRTKRFKVYLANKFSSLFDEKNMVADVKNDGNLEKLDYIFDEEQEARFFAIRILDPVASSGVSVANAFTRIQELMLYGTRKESNVSIENENFTASENVVADLSAKDNILYNREYHEILQYTDGVDTSDNGERYMLARKTKLTNGVANDAVFFPGTIYFGSDGTPKNKPPYEVVTSYTAISYYLGGEAEIDEVWIYNHTNKALANYVYEIYVSDSNLTLYEETNLVKRYTNSTSASLQKFIFNKAYKGEYLGIKFLVPVHTSSGVSEANKYVRLSQIAAFGSVKSKEAPSAYKELYAKYDYNVIKDKTPEVFAQNGSKYEAVDGKFKNLTDQEFENEIQVSSVKFAEIKDGSIVYYENGERYVDFIFDFGTTVDIDAISLTNHPTENRMNSKYSFFAENSRDKLFDEASQIQSFENVAKEKTNVFEFGDDNEYKYFGLRVTDPCCGEVTVNDAINEAFVRISDLAIFGSYTDPAYKVNNVEKITNLSEEEFKAMGDSLIKGYETPKWFYNSATIPAPWAYVKQSKVLTDGKLDTHADFTDSKYKLSTTDGSNKLDVMYSFAGMMDFSGFTFIGTSEVANTAYFTGWYQVYVAEDPDEVFLPENMIFEHNWQKDGPARGHNVTFDNYTARGMAFGIRILSPVTTATTWPIPRLSEIAVYGKVANVPILPTNLAANMPVFAYAEDKNGKLSEVDEKDFTAAEAKMLTDGKTDTSASIKASGEKIHLLYNLCNDVLLTDIKLQSSAKSYKVYGSNDINKVWEKDSLIYSYNGKGSNGKTLTGKNATKKYRYVRFEITDFTGPLKLTEAEVIGGDNQLLKYKQISRTFSYGNVNLTTYNYETKVHDFFSTDAYLYKLFDNDIYTSICIEGGMHNEETVDMTVTFDDVKNIDSISLYFPDMLDGYNPTKLELYTSENLKEFSEGIPEGTEPLATFNTLPEDGLYKVDFRPQFARVMVIRFICGNLEYDGYEDLMCFALNEIKIMGTSVVGIQPDEFSPELLSFTDEATGVTAQVLKYDKNDIYTNVSGIRVSKAPATLAQKKSLVEEGLLKIIDETVYTVDFVDNLGRVVTDLGGRKHRIIIPFDRTKNDYLMMAYANGDDCVVLDSRVEGEMVYCDREDFANNQYMLVGFGSSKDPYFEDLNVEISDEDDNDVSNLEDDFSTTPEENIFDGIDVESDVLDEIPDEVTPSPETGERKGPLATAIVLFALSALSITALKRREMHLNKK